MSGFIDQVKLKVPDTSPLRVIGGLVQKGAWRHAPSATEELQWLTRLGARSARGEPARTPDLKSLVDAMRRETDQRFSDFWREASNTRSDAMQAFGDQLAMERSRQLGPSSRAAAGPDIVRQLRTAQGVADLVEDEQRFNVHGLALITFLRTFFRFRLENAWEMLENFGCNSTPSVRLLCPAMVDFDLWLGNPNLDQGRTPSHIDLQLEVMAEISRTTQGRVHGFAPFNPLRAACQGGDYVSRYIHAAVERHGCLGFKLYPPMGFAPIGNAQIAGPLPRCDNAAGVTRSQLDDVLLHFFRTCASLDVPVLAHTSPSNAAYQHAENLGSPAHWATLLQRLEQDGASIRISLGHMGGNHAGDTNTQWRSEIVTLMDRYPGRVYADLSYYQDVLGSTNDRLVLVKQLAPIRRKPISDSVMYGSDWTMLSAVPRAKRYLTDFSRFLTGDMQLDAQIVDNVFRTNAVRFFGLTPKGSGLERLRTFHRGTLPRPLQEVLATS